MEAWDNLVNLLSSERTQTALRAVLILGAGLVVARLAASAVRRAARDRLDRHQTMIFRRGAYFVTLAIFAATALHQLGFNMGVLFGAAGVLSVAIGFASQTSASNLVSGLFLLSEKPFAVGDVIEVENTLGEVISIDLLSVKLRTPDNLFVRLPNETMIKSEVTTLTKFPQRRIDLGVPVGYQSKIDQVRSTLLAVAAANPRCLKQPAPQFFFRAFGDSSLDLQFSVWVATADYAEVKTELYTALHHTLAERGIDIPYPQRTLHLSGGWPQPANDERSADA